MLFTLIAGWDRLADISHILFDDEKTVEWSIELIIPIGVFLIIIGIIIKIIEPIKAFKSYAKK
jgi:TRAP-type mannitol/chloroaromatic compound transport system permease small subunit